MIDFEEILLGGDLRSIGRSNTVAALVNDRESFNQLFQLLSSNDRNVVMRAADAIEKITYRQPQFLQEHKSALIQLSKNAVHKELKWHLALLLARLPLSTNELGQVWQVLSTWATDKKESRIVRVNAIQSLFDLLPYFPSLKDDLAYSIDEIEKEQIPSINARLRKLRKYFLK